MKKALLLKPMLLLFALIVGSSSVWAVDQSFTITTSSFTDLPSAAAYGTYSWTSGGVNGKGQIFANTSSEVMQMNGGNANGKIIYNTTALPGNLKKINIIRTSDSSNRSYSVYGRTTSYSGTGDYGTLISTANIAADPGHNYVVSTGNYSFFVIVAEASKASYLSSITVTYEPVNYTINAISNDNTMGSVTISGLTITANPNTGYRVKAGNNAFTVTEGTATVVNNGDNTFTVAPSTNCTITINFEAIPTHDVTFSINGATTTNSFYEDAQIIFPETPSDIGDMKFVGWVDATINGKQENAPTFIPNTIKMGIEDVTYYAVFAKVTGSGDETATLTASHTTNSTTYANHTYTDDKGFTWSGYNTEPYESNKARYGLTNTGTPTPYFESPTFSGNIKSIKIAVYNGSGSARTFKINSKKTDNSGDLGTVSVPKNTSTFPETDATLGSTTFNQFYLGASAALGFSYIKVTYHQIYYTDYCTTVANTTLPFTINSAATDGTLYYTTFSSPYPFEVPEEINGEYFEVSEISVVDGKLYVEKYAIDAVVPANTGVMVAATAAGNYSFNVSSEEGQSLLEESNYLLPTGEGITAAQMAQDGYKFYALTKSGGKLGFWYVVEGGAAFDYNVANRAYLAVPTSELGNAPALGFGFDDETTSIQNIERTINDNQYYTLDGRRVAQPTKGLYILNGRKVIVK